MSGVILAPRAISNLDDWRKTDIKILVKIIALIAEIAQTPFTGTGKPEPLKHDFKGKWSRRITQEHRLIYEVTDTSIRILSCKFHYE